MSPPNPHTTSGGLPRKRTLQACEPCRRKKSKCSGQLPECSTCNRLEQRCFYRRAYYPASLAEEPFMNSAISSDTGPEQPAEGTQSNLHDRLRSVETTLANLINSLRDGSLPASTSDSFLPLPSSQPVPHHHKEVQDRAIATPATTMPSNSSLITSPGDTTDNSPIRSWTFALDMAKVFLLYCVNQPLPLFWPDTFVSTFPNRALEVVYAVLAVAFRFISIADATDWHKSLPDARECAKGAYLLAMSHIADGHIELSTLQTLCLLAVFELNNSNMVQCRVHATLALSLARSAQLDCDRRVTSQEDHIVEERRRCYWSIVLLHHIIGEPMTSPTAHFPRPPFPASAASPPPVALNPAGQTVATSEAPTDENGISSIVIQLSEVWCMAQSYVRTRGGAADGHKDAFIRGYGQGQPGRWKVPPWHSTSKYSSTLELVMNLGDNLPPAHRYRFINLPRVTCEELLRDRDYWGPWLLSRFLYHTTLCLLSHPILIMLQIQGNRDVSEVFLQQTTSSRIQHTSWLLHFLEFVDSRQFFVSDPIFGYCAAVLASIELHQTFVESEESMAKRRRRNYDLCIRFLRSLGNRWPFMQHAANKLQRLMELTSTLYQSSRASPDAQKLTVDISGFFQILDFSEFCSSENATSPFGPSLGHRRMASDSPVTGVNTSLTRLPSITEINNSHPSRNEPDRGTAGRDRQLRPHDNQSTTHTPTDTLPHTLSSFAYLPSEEVNDLFLQADQLFGPLYDSISPWDTSQTLGT